MRIIYFAAIIFFSFASFSQQTTKPPWDSLLRSEMKEYVKILKKADIYLEKAEAKIEKASFYKTESVNYFDSAGVAARKAPSESNNTQFYFMQFNFLYNLSCDYLKKADSLLADAQKYKDTASAVNIEAEAYFLKIAERFEKDYKSDSLFNAVYVIQIATGNMPYEYFKKIRNVEVITTGDGITRYIVGRYKTTEEALEAKNKLYALGYKESFIRTLNSLDY